MADPVRPGRHDLPRAARYATAAPLAGGQFQLPWRQGYSWKANGAHSHTGSGYPYSSIDVSYDWPGWGGATYTVTAANSGTVTVFSRCQVRVTAPNGWATNYYHMSGISVRSGDYVAADTPIGTYAGNRNEALCEGGSSTGPHLHFSLLYNGCSSPAGAEAEQLCRQRRRQQLRRQLQPLLALQPAQWPALLRLAAALQQRD